jgi:hypothetical protein
MYFLKQKHNGTELYEQPLGQNKGNMVNNAHLKLSAIDKACDSMSEWFHRLQDLSITILDKLRHTRGHIYNHVSWPQIWLPLLLDKLGSRQKCPYAQQPEQLHSYLQRQIV